MWPHLPPGGHLARPSGAGLSRPFFVSLIGSRYGWIPHRDSVRISDDPQLQWIGADPDGPEREALRGSCPHSPCVGLGRDLDVACSCHIKPLASCSAGRSITEMEIMHGMLNSKLPCHAFAYFRSNDFLKDVTDDAVKKTFMCSSEEEAEWLEALKTRIDAVPHCAVTENYACHFDAASRHFFLLAPSHPCRSCQLLSCFETAGSACAGGLAVPSSCAPRAGCRYPYFSFASARSLEESTLRAPARTPGHRK